MILVVVLLSFVNRFVYLPIALMGSTTTVTKRSARAILRQNTDSSFLRILHLLMAITISRFPAVPTTEPKQSIKSDEKTVQALAEL